MTAAGEGVAETTLADELNLDRAAMRKRRGALEQGKDWWTGGPTNRTVFWSADAADFLRESLGDTEPDPPDDTRMLRVVKLPPNDRAVLCDDGGKAVRVNIKRGMGPKLLKKSIKVRSTPDGVLFHIR